MERALLYGYEESLKNESGIQANMEGKALLREMTNETLHHMYNEMGFKTLISAEKVIKYPLLGALFKNWCIKADLVFEDKEGLWLGDFKTTSGYGAATASYYHNSPQTLTYFKIGKSQMPEIRGTKIIVTTKGSKKEAPKVFVETIILSKKDLNRADELIENALYRAEEIEKENKYPKNLLNCYKFRDRDCEYIPLCHETLTEEYYNNLMLNWFSIKDPEHHLFAKEGESKND